MEIISWLFVTVFAIYGVFRLLRGLYFNDNPKAYAEWRRAKRKKDPTIWWEEQEGYKNEKYVYDY